MSENKKSESEHTQQVSNMMDDNKKSIYHQTIKQINQNNGTKQN